MVSKSDPCLVSKLKVKKIGLHILVATNLNRSLSTLSGTKLGIQTPSKGQEILNVFKKNQKQSKFVLRCSVQSFFSQCDF